MWLSILRWRGCCLVAKSCLTLCNPMDCRMPRLPVSHHLPKFAQVHVIISDATQPSHPLTLSSPSALTLSQIRDFSNESAVHIRWLKDRSFSFNISISNQYSGLISLKIDWFDLLAVKGTLKSLLQLHTLKASILLGSAFFIVQLSKPCMTTGKTIALTIWTFVGRVTSLLFNMLSRLVITFLPSKEKLRTG